MTQDTYDTSEVRSTLNDLIQTLKDGEEGFRSAAEHASSSSLRSKFQEFEAQRADFAGELQSLVATMGEEPAKSGSTAGAIHRGWIGLKSAITGNDDHAILAEAERGEDSAVKNYRDALSKNLPSETRAMIDLQYREIQAAHNQIRALRDSVQSSSKTTTTRSTY